METTEARLFSIKVISSLTKESSSCVVVERQIVSNKICIVQNNIQCDVPKVGSVHLTGRYTGESVTVLLSIFDQFELIKVLTR